MDTYVTDLCVHQARTDDPETEVVHLLTGSSPLLPGPARSHPHRYSAVAMWKLPRLSLVLS